MRCKCCNNVLEETEIIWYEDRLDHEDFCVMCRNKFRDEQADENVIDAYNSDDDVLLQFVPKSKSSGE